VTELQGCSHQAFELSVGAWSSPTSSVERSSRASASGQRLTVNRREDRLYGGKVAVLQRRVRVECRSLEHSNVEGGAFDSSIGVKPAFGCQQLRGRAR
jgi:hypothetical protein